MLLQMKMGYHDASMASFICFTEQAVLMLSSVLNSDRAIAVNTQIIRGFTKIREILSHHEHSASD